MYTCPFAAEPFCRIVDMRQVREQNTEGLEVRRYVFRHACWYNISLWKLLGFWEVGGSRIPIDPSMEEGGSHY